MKTIHFTIGFCGYTADLFSENILISKPFASYDKTYSMGSDIPQDSNVSDLIARIFEDSKNDNHAVSQWGSVHLHFYTVYVQTNDALLGLQDDKRLSDMFEYFDCEHIELFHFCVCGGASAWCSGYQFIVHPNEDIHKFHPHVHVRRNGNETRYSLDTLNRFPNDSFTREFQRDEKKVILPYLRKNQAKLRRYWDNYMNGYIPPMEDADGKQFYNES